MEFYSKILMFSIIFIFVISCKEKEERTTGGKYNIFNHASANKAKKYKKTPVISFDRTEYNFGTLIQGERVSHTFYFTNSGGSNLIISNVETSCGCTAPKWPREAISPGKKGKIEIIFDSRGRSGIHDETIHVYANTQPNLTELFIRCDIVN